MFKIFDNFIDQKKQKNNNKQQLKGKVTFSAFSVPSMSKTPSNLFWS
jgi:hypothetical protein